MTARFQDPFRLFAFELPLGWVYDRWDSQLLRPQFHWFRDPSRALGAQPLPPLVTAEASDNEWFRKLVERISPQSLRPNTYLRFAGRAVPTTEAECDNPIHAARLTL